MRAPGQPSILVFLIYRVYARVYVHVVFVDRLAYIPGISPGLCSIYIPPMALVTKLDNRSLDRIGQ